MYHRGLTIHVLVLIICLFANSKVQQRTKAMGDKREEYLLSLPEEYLPSYLVNGTKPNLEYCNRYYWLPNILLPIHLSLFLLYLYANQKDGARTVELRESHGLQVYWTRLWFVTFLKLVATISCTLELALKFIGGYNSDMLSSILLLISIGIAFTEVIFKMTESLRTKCRNSIDEGKKRLEELKKLLEEDFDANDENVEHRKILKVKRRLSVPANQ